MNLQLLHGADPPTLVPRPKVGRPGRSIGSHGTPPDMITHAVNP